jgi:hypothetical protein
LYLAFYSHIHRFLRIDDIERIIQDTSLYKTEERIKEQASHWIK